MLNYAELFRRLPRERVWFIADLHFGMGEEYLGVFGLPISLSDIVQRVQAFKAGRKA